MTHRGTTPGGGLTVSLDERDGISGDRLRHAVTQGIEALAPTGRVVLVIPDTTRTMDVPAVVAGALDAMDGAASLDLLVALGTHPPLPEAASLAHVGLSTLPPGVRILQHAFEDPEALVHLGEIPRATTRRLSSGMLDEDIPVAVNRAVTEADLVIVAGPVFPHEVVGMSGGTKYLFPGLAARPFIDAMHWLGALVTSKAIIGVADTPVRALVDHAASMIPTPMAGVMAVMDGEATVGLHMGAITDAWQAAEAQSRATNVVYTSRTYQQVLSLPAPRYDDLWVAAKAMYKLEPIVADGGRLVIYAPWLTEVSSVHGEAIVRAGYHVRDYFLAHWDEVSTIPRGVLAHCTHLKGDGRMIDGVERPRITVALATGLPEEVCNAMNLEYIHPAAVDPGAWKARYGDEGLVVHHAGEVLYRPHRAEEG